MANETGVKLAEDRYQNKLQISHVNTARFLALAADTPTVYTADFDQHVCITGASDAFIQVRRVSTAAATDEGFNYLGGTYYHTTLRKGEYISSTAAIHICSIGESIEES